MEYKEYKEYIKEYINSLTPSANQRGTARSQQKMKKKTLVKHLFYLV
jgi:hypothetical protein